MSDRARVLSYVDIDDRTWPAGDKVIPLVQAEPGRVRESLPGNYMTATITAGVLALQGAFHEHIVLLRQAAESQDVRALGAEWAFAEVRNSEELFRCDALIIPGGESTTMALVAARSNLLEPLRDFVKAQRRPTWGTCAGMILLAEAANRTKKGGQELIGGLDVRVDRNHFGRQTESFEADLSLAFLPGKPFKGIFIRAPIVQRVLPQMQGVQSAEERLEETVVAPSKQPTRGTGPMHESHPVHVLGVLGRETASLPMAGSGLDAVEQGEAGKIVAVQQWNVFGTSFHPELTGDARIHEWWLLQVFPEVEARKKIA